MGLESLYGLHISMVTSAWHAADYGVRVSERIRLTHLIWSDNVYFIAKSVSELMAMIKTITEVMSHYGIQWKKDSVMWMEAGEKDDTDETPTTT